MQARAQVNNGPRLVAARYELHDVLGRGGMGIVWRGQDRVLDRPVAVKEVFPPPGLFGDERAAVKARVLREARAAARLGHPGVVTVFDLVEEDDRIFIVMEFVPGPSLEELVIREGPLAPAVVADVGLQILDVLESAHASGIIHRDVKPGNILIVAEGRAKLGDFGIASIAGDPKLTVTGMVLGSPSFMAPEQAKGEGVGPATDLWGLGASLYFATEGHPPFRKDQPIPTLAAVMQEDPTPPERSDGLGPIVLDLMAKDPAARPSGASLREMLGRVKAAGPLAGEETTERLARIAASHPKTPVTPPDQTLAVAAWRPEPKPEPVVEAPIEPVVEPPAAPVVVGAPAEEHEPTDHGLWPWSEAAEDQPAPEEAPRPRRPRLPAVFVGALLAIVVLFIAGVSFLTTSSPSATNRSPTTNKPKVAQSPKRAEPSPAPATPKARKSSAPTTAPSTAPPKSKRGPSVSSLPAGWTYFTDRATGYRLAKPSDWTIGHPYQNTTDFKNPDGGMYLRVGWRYPANESAKKDWVNFSKDFARTHSGYKEIQITETTFKGYPAA
ncbi:MAG TPA: protein kinase, partial [Actinomycetota bacterium]